MRGPVDLIVDAYILDVSRLGIELEHCPDLTKIVEPIIQMDIEAVFYFVSDINNCNLAKAETIYKRNTIFAHTIIECYEDSIGLLMRRLCNIKYFDTEVDPANKLLSHYRIHHEKYITRILQCFVLDPYLEKRLKDMFYDKIIKKRFDVELDSNPPKRRKMD